MNSLRTYRTEGGRIENNLNGKEMCRSFCVVLGCVVLLCTSGTERGARRQGIENKLPGDNIVLDLVNSYQVYRPCLFWAVHGCLPTDVDPPQMEVRFRHLWPPQIDHSFFL